jgi:hypothetical protein
VSHVLVEVPSQWREERSKGKEFHQALTLGVGSPVERVAGPEDEGVELSEPGAPGVEVAAPARVRQLRHLVQRPVRQRHALRKEGGVLTLWRGAGRWYALLIRWRVAWTLALGLMSWSRHPPCSGGRSSGGRSCRCGRRRSGT